MLAESASEPSGVVNPPSLPLGEELFSLFAAVFCVVIVSLKSYMSWCKLLVCETTCFWNVFVGFLVCIRVLTAAFFVVCESEFLLTLVVGFLVQVMGSILVVLSIVAARSI